MVKNSTDFDVFGNDMSLDLSYLDEAREVAAAINLGYYDTNRRDLIPNSNDFGGPLTTKEAMLYYAARTSAGMGDVKRGTPAVTNNNSANLDQGAEGSAENQEQEAAESRNPDEEAKKISEEKAKEAADMMSQAMAAIGSIFGGAAIAASVRDAARGLTGVEDDGISYDNSMIASPNPSFMPDNAKDVEQFIDFSGFYPTVEKTELAYKGDASPGQNFAPSIPPVVGIPQGTSRGHVVGA